MTTRRTILDLGAVFGVAAALALGHAVVRSDAFARAAEEPELTLCGEGEADPAGGAALARRPVVPRIEARDAVPLVGAPGVTFVDARGAHSYVLGHVPGALCLPVGEALGILGSSSLPLAPDDLVIAYCDSLACGDAEALSSLLRERLGCREIRVIEGGWEQWLAAGGPSTDEREEADARG